MTAEKCGIGALNAMNPTCDALDDVNLSYLRPRRNKITHRSAIHPLLLANQGARDARTLSGVNLHIERDSSGFWFSGVAADWQIISAV
jgi:hypothetical protein